MSVSHHPDDFLLLDHLAGALDPALALVVDTHLSFCAQCRAEAARGDVLGGVLLEEATPVALGAEALGRVMARLDKPRMSAGPDVSRDNTPAPLRAFLGRDLSDVRWRSLGPRLSYATLYRRGRLSLRLLRGQDGTDVGRHSHRGLEFTLVVRGGFTDETGSYGPGDFQTASGAVIHNPVADKEGCINLSVTTDRLQFANRLQGLVAGVLGF